MLANESDQEKRPVGRPHLDGSPAGKGEYIKRVSLRLSEKDDKDLKKIGGGNRYEAVRMLLEMYRRLQEDNSNG